MNLQELQALNAVGQLPNVYAPGNVVYPQYPNPCSIVPNPGRTAPNVGIDLSQLIQSGCGLFQLSVGTTTATPQTFYALGGGVETGAAAIIKEMYDEIPNIAFAVDTASFTDGANSAIYASAGFSNWYNEKVAHSFAMIVGTISFESTGTDASFATLRHSKFISSELSPQNNWSSTAVKYAAQMCSPCGNGDIDTTVQWNITAAPIGPLQLLGIALPAGTAGEFTFCVQSFQASTPMTPCSGSSIAYPATPAGA